MFRVALIPPLVAFAGLMLAAALLVLSASGHFPRRTRDHDFGALALWLSLLVGFAATVAGIIAAWRVLPWAPAVIAGGLGILAAPLVLQRFPDRFVDGHGALATFGGGAAALAVILIMFAA